MRPAKSGREERNGEALRHVRQLFALSTDLLCVVRPNFGLHLSNPAFVETLGYETSDVPSMNLLDLIHPDDRARFEASFREREEQIRSRIRWRDGSYRSVDWRIQKDAQSELFYLLGRETTEIRSVQDALRDSDEKVQALLENAAQGILSVDGRGRIISVNSMAEKLFGYPRSELVGRSVEMLLPASLAEAHARHRAGYFQSPRTRPMGLGMDLVGLRKDGSEFPVEISLSHLRSENETLAVAFINDITERKRAESEKERLEHRLEHATKMEAVGRLAGGIAHDFNNLLTALSGFAEVALDELSETHPLYEGARETLKTCQRSASLVRRLLAVSRSQLLQPEILDLNAKVAEIEKMLRSVLGEDIDFIVNLEEGLGFVRADQSQFEHVLLNLVVNARDAMPTGGRLVVESARAEVDEAEEEMRLGIPSGSYALIKVSDTGHGMDADTLGHIFEPFFTTKEKGKGTGLGLATVYGVVKQSGGHIWVYSEPGRGATFKIYLPLVDRSGHPQRERARVASTAGGSETILVVEDESAVRIVTVANLKRAGYRVLEARDAEEALSIVRGHAEAIDLVLSDVLMPGMNGPELAKRLAKILPKVKVLLMSGHADDALLHHGILEGGLAFLEKPFSRTDLTSRVREVLDRK